MQKSQYKFIVNNLNLNKKIVNIIILLFLLFGFSVSVESIYFGKPEPSFSYPFAGFIIVEVDNSNLLEDKFVICGANFVSPVHVITAAHCVQNAKSTAVSIGYYNESIFRQTTTRNILRIPLNYDASMFEKGKRILVEDIGASDIALVELDNPVNIEKYAQLAKPTKGCEYFVVGYGQNEAENTKLHERRGIDVCIDTINLENLLVSFPNGGFFCNGDSGSGLYRKGTNELVGVVSALNSENSCKDADLYIVTRIDANWDFLKLYLETTNDILPNQNLPFVASENKEGFRNTSVEKVTDKEIIIALFIILGIFIFFFILVVLVITLLIVIIAKIKDK